MISQVEKRFMKVSCHYLARRNLRILSSNVKQSDLSCSTVFSHFPSRFMSTDASARCLVIAELSGDSVSQGTLSAITAANKITNNVELLLAGGDNVSAVASKTAQIKGISKVFFLQNALISAKVAENMAKTVLNVAKNYTHIVCPSSNFGKNFIPRVAAQLDASPLSDVLDVIDSSTYKRPMYAGNAIATVKMGDPLKFLLVRPTAFEKATSSGGAASVEELKLSEEQVDAKMSKFVSEAQTKSARPDLGTAKVVVSGGRGMKSAENFPMLEKLADKLGGAVGASRAAVDAGFAPNDYQVGQTGKVVAPDLYIAVGISGAIQHLSGMKDSKVIVAINKDKDAPIFQVADYGIVDDLFKVVPEMTTKV